MTQTLTAPATPPVRKGGGGARPRDPAPAAPAGRPGSTSPPPWSSSPAS
ncbi:hypothetical protein HX747_09140 [Streptomyces sp. L06]|nr:hypothetical protein [Streptomyces sp. L06]